MQTVLGHGSVGPDPFVIYLSKSHSLVTREKVKSANIPTPPHGKHIGFAATTRRWPQPRRARGESAHLSVTRKDGASMHSYPGDMHRVVPKRAAPNAALEASRRGLRKRHPRDTSILPHGQRPYRYPHPDSEVHSLWSSGVNVTKGSRQIRCVTSGHALAPTVSVCLLLLSDRAARAPVP